MSPLTYPHRPAPHQHSAGCWRWHGHHGCTVALVEELAQALQVLRDRHELDGDEQLMVQQLLEKVGGGQ